MYLLGQDDQWRKELSDKPQGDRRSVRTISTTTIEPYLADYCFFSCAPLYVFAGVPYSIPDQFELEATPQDRIIVDYQRELLGGMGRWGWFLEGIAKNVWEDFCHYVSTLMFMSKPKETLWTVRAHDLNIEGTQPDIATTGQLPVRARIFLPDGNRGRLCVKGGYPAKFWWESPQPALTAMANKVLNLEGRIDQA